MWHNVAIKLVETLGQETRWKRMMIYFVTDHRTSHTRVWPTQLWFRKLKNLKPHYRTAGHSTTNVFFCQRFTAQLSCQPDSSFPSWVFREISSLTWDQRILRKEQRELPMHPSCPLENLGSEHWMHFLLRVCLLLLVVVMLCCWWHPYTSYYALLFDVRQALENQDLLPCEAR